MTAKVIKNEDICTQFYEISMKKILFLFLLASTSVNATSYWVSSDGNDTNSGISLNTPFKTLTKAESVVLAGDIIFVRGGNYLINSTIYLTKSGTKEKPVRLEGYQNERPLFNCSGTSFGKRGFQLSGNYWHIKGIDIMKAGDNGMLVSGAYNTIEFCSFFDNKDSGLQLSNGANNNKIINCDSYWNADPEDYGDADGFACKMDVGSNNYFYGCRAWLNVDDGWDGYLRGANDISTVCENCWTWKNGWTKNGIDYGDKANGNGFKMGGSDNKDLMHNFTLINCLSFDNKSKGFDQNNDKGNMLIKNCTGFRNKGHNYSVYLNLAAGKTCSIINCISYNGTINIGSFVNQGTNSWLSGFSVNMDDFISLDTLGVSSKRNSDGSLPLIGFMRLKKTSYLIDRGTNIGLPYEGNGPDLGAFEYTENVSGIENAISDQKYYFSNNELKISGEVKLKNNIKIFDTTGRVIVSESNILNNSIELSRLKKGIYFFEFVQNKKYLKGKINRF